MCQEEICKENKISHDYLYIIDIKSKISKTIKNYAVHVRDKPTDNFLIIICQIYANF